MSNIALAGGLRPRRAKSSDEYVNEIIARRGSKTAAKSTMSREAKVQKLAMVLSDQINGIRRLGVGMVGPIQLKLRYQGVIRSILLEDPRDPSVPIEYEVLDDYGQAYLMSGTEGEVRITPFEGKRVRVETFRIAARPAVRKEDLIRLQVSVVEHAQDETKQAIQKQEDTRLMSLLTAARDNFATRADHTLTPTHNVNEVSGMFTYESLYAAAALVDPHEIRSQRLLMYSGDHRDLYRWNVNDTGWSFKDEVVAGMEITRFGEFIIQKSVTVPQGLMYVLPDPDFLGVFPIEYSLDVEENHLLEAFWRGWVFDELVGMAVLNPTGIVTITK